MSTYAQEPLSESALRLLFRGLAILHLALGIWLFVFPHSFFTTIGAFDSYSRHYERDVSTFYFAFAFGAWIAAARPGWRIPVLSVFTLQYAIHTINHIIDVDRSRNSWAGIFDVASLGLATVQFVGLLWLLLRRRPGAGRR